MIPDFNTIDIVVLVVLALSALVGLSRGFTREVLGIGGWVGAFFISLYGLIFIRPFLVSYIKDPFVLDVVAGSTLFLISLILLTMLSRHLSIKVKSGALGGLDRSLGLVFGFARGWILLSLALLVFSFFVAKPEKWPTAIRTAKSMPYIIMAASWLRKLVPEDAVKNLGLKSKPEFEDTKTPKVSTDNIVKSLSRPQPASRDKKKNKSGDGYKRDQLSDMDRLFNNYD